MSVAYYIVLDNDEPGFDTFVNGKALAQEKNLESLCKRLGLKIFEDFMSMSGEDILDMLGDVVELPEDMKEEWFTPDEGLTYFSTIAGHIEASPSSVLDPEGCLEDLTEYTDVLTKAKKIGARWHLNLDI